MAIVPESLRRIAGLHRHASCRPSQPALRSLNQDPPKPARHTGPRSHIAVNDETSRSTCRNGATSIATPSVVACSALALPSWKRDGARVAMAVVAVSCTSQWASRMPHTPRHPGCYLAPLSRIHGVPLWG
ncbi:Os04g0290700 [Oryza sativa Japonica Group]|uniref:Os04g0290700 protein n=1 Tax=Oryza sativa subsp. japonica TaxID=39947 RepID=A0A0P0W897_ORYSJ|nr:Os04g0290700 [Oryza sativa Japonica Group]